MSVDYTFLRKAGRILNSGQSRSLILTGNVNDLFSLSDGTAERYVPLADFLTARWAVPGAIVLVYELNGPIRFAREADREPLKDAWLRWRTGMDANQFAIRNMLSNGKLEAEARLRERDFDANLQAAAGQPTLALEFLRQLCLCSRTERDGVPILPQRLIILVEAADMLLPEGDITHLSEADRHRICICRDWFSDPGFMDGDDAVVLIAESRSQLNARVATLPHMAEAAIPAPDTAERAAYIRHYAAALPPDKALTMWGTETELASASAGLTVLALRQLLAGAAHERRTILPADVIERVEQHARALLGEDTIEFKKPTHTLDNVIGFTSLKAFLRKEFIPRLRATGAESLSGAAVGGAIGGGKTFIFEAVASELGIVVLVLKNIRSQWFGQTDVIFERLRRVLESMDKVLIFVDEADTQFGGVGPDAHATERRLTGRIQAMMSDPALRGRVAWLLMTARVHLLSPDIRRPGRVGDLIIPILDPEGDDRRAFVAWCLEKGLRRDATGEEIDAVYAKTDGYSAADFASVRSELSAHATLEGHALSFDGIDAIFADRLPPDIGPMRRYQLLQALVNCTRRSLLPDPACTEKEREAWRTEIRAMEAMGIR